ncbi:MAG: hypothetical protein WD004_00390 [Actinomycetota bacterium]
MRRWMMFAAAALLVLALGATACKKDQATQTPKPTEPTALPSSPPPDVSAGGYAYNSYGVVATLEPDDDTSFTMTIENKTGEGLAKPAIYALDARDGHEIKATVEGSAPLNSGQEKEFTVTFAEDFDKNNVGLIILEFGAANWGAFTPSEE